MMRVRKNAALATGLSLTAALLTSVTAPAQAATPAPNDDNTMGSQIRRVEGQPEQQQQRAGLQVAAGSVAGLDVSHHQGDINWKTYWDAGKRFVWIKATEGTDYRDPKFNANYGGSLKQGFIRGAYHFARPNSSSGAAQAKFFGDHGGGWSGDGKTLPGTIDMEYAPSGDACYGLSTSAMTNWIRDFSDSYHSRWHKYPAIYTSTSWWNKCTGGADFSKTNPLWVARYNSQVGALPGGWKVYTVWQFTDKPYDQDTFNGDAGQLSRFATNAD